MSAKAEHVLKVVIWYNDVILVYKQVISLKDIHNKRRFCCGAKYLEIMLLRKLRFVELRLTHKCGTLNNIVKRLFRLP